MGISDFIQNNIIGITFGFTAIPVKPRWVGSKLLRELRWVPNDGIGEGDFSREVIEEGLTIGKSDGGDTLCERVVHVISVLEMVVLDVKYQGFESVEVALFRTVGRFHGTWEGIVGAEEEIVIDSDDFVDLAPDCEIAKGGEWVH